MLPLADGHSRSPRGGGRTAASVMRVMNLVPTAILRSPAHWLMSRDTLLLTFTGRRSRRRYTVPVVYYQRNTELLVTTDSGWWRNLVGGADVVVRLHGHDQTARAVADPDPRQVSVVLEEMVRRYPFRYTRLAAQHGHPGAAQRALIKITLNPNETLVMAPARPPVDDGTVLVTGTSGGIGRELAVQLAARAGTLVLLARRAGLLEELRADLLAQHPHLRVVALPVDLSDEGDVDRVLAKVYEQVGPVDVLVNNAGVGDQALFDQASWTRTRQVLRTNVVAVTQLTAALVPSMVVRGRGGILNIGSGAGLTLLPAAAAYSASKHFVDGFSEALRADLAGTGVVVTQVCPGPVDSGFDTVAGTAGGMTGGPPQLLRISAAQCAREALAGFDRGAALVFPGRAYRMAMRVLPLLPRSLQRRRAAQAATRMRSTGAAAGPRSIDSDVPQREAPE